MKRNVFALVMVALMMLLPSLDNIARAAAGEKVFGHGFALQVEPIQVEVKGVSKLNVRPGEPVTITYQITNHSTQTHWNLKADLLIAGAPTDAPIEVGVKHRWMLRGAPYTPGTVFQIASGTIVILKAVITAPDYAGSIPLNINIYRVSGETGKG